MHCIQLIFPRLICSTQLCILPWVARGRSCCDMVGIRQRSFMQELIFIQVIIPGYNGFHVHYSCCPSRDLFCAAIERLDLYLGCRECWAKVCEILRVSRCLVVLYSLDDVHSEQLSGQVAQNVTSYALIPLSRQQPITLFLNWPFGTSISLVVLETTTSAGVHSSGAFLS